MSETKKPLEIFTVFGPENSGKTTLMWDVYNKLIATGGDLTYFHIIGADAKDFHAIVVWEGKIIAICSIGDKADPSEKDNTNEKDTTPTDDWKYIQDGLAIAQEYKTDILLNTVSDFCCKKENEKYNSKNNIDKYEEKLSKINYNMKEFILDKSPDDTIEILISKKQKTYKAIITELQRLC